MNPREQHQMAIDPLQETLISLKDAAKLFPKNARGKYPHISAIYRYTKTGCRGVILESIQAGSVRCASRESVALFFRQLTEQAKTAAVPKRKPNNNAAELAGQILDRTLFKSGRRAVSRDDGGLSR